MSRAKAGTHKRTVTGVWGKCLSCRQKLPLHPDLKMCGACTFGEASELMAFDGTWVEEEK